MKTAYKNLGDFVQALEKEGELLRIQAPVSRDLEITQITDIMCKSPGGGKALLFENVLESPFPVLTNAFGSEKRITMALGVRHLDDLAARVRRFLEIEPPKSLAHALRLLPLGLDLLRFVPRKVRTAPCQDVVLRGPDLDLNRLPVLKCWPKDGGPFVTLPVVITRSLKTGKRNAGMYRLQVYDAKTTGMHWHIHKDGSHYFQEYRAARKPMPVAVAVGTDPATTYAATAPLPRGVDEMILSGFIRQAPVPMTRAVTVPLDVPAEAEFILEGYVDPEELRVEGPFGDHTGYYSLTDLYPVFHLTAITHRKHPIYPATVVGRPPMEDCYLAKATERLFLPLLQTVLPEIKDYWLPWEGVFHNITVVAMEKEYPGHGRKVMSALWGQGQMSFCKALVMVDAHVDLHRPDRVLETVLNNVDLERDLYITEGVLDVLDHSAPQPLFGGKVGLDATARLASEPQRPQRARPESWPDDAQLLAKARQISERFTGCRRVKLDVLNPVLLLNVIKDGTASARSLAPALMEADALKPVTIFVLYDQDIALQDGSLVLWKLFNNVDPLRDIVRKGSRLVVDATKKGPEDGHLRPWPDDIVMDPEVVQRVRRRAQELGIAAYLD
ncbi:menaquinone biosynthesis decarboxylase [Desulfosoma caldarium]|uniref:4-hydroxy-3-polyprenylbenzoate decarboxylase n=1 Tax=Desulfosoma caldarium TaxID=610254 RepID=A0A3N1V1T8_9BACT|nr:menaquinone biosynthesis decarboxylase [Desulfosoma caldarium]ROQ93456.1 4-hydroxy-3-polyprenylbenzoate decarboxylase [Desulfosoma caldarium]